jgi:hypothetical protein
VRLQKLYHKIDDKSEGDWKLEYSRLKWLSYDGYYVKKIMNRILGMDEMSVRKNELVNKFTVKTDALKMN